MMRPEASDTTGTLRETSGVTVPVTTNSEVVACSVAAASGNCSGRSTEKRAASGNGTTLGSGGAPATVGSPPVCAWTLLQPASENAEAIKVRSSVIFKAVFVIGIPPQG